MGQHRALNAGEVFGNMLGDLGAAAGGLSLLVLAVRSLAGDRTGVGGRLSLVAGGAVSVARHRCLA